MPFLFTRIINSSYNRILNLEGMIIMKEVIFKLIEQLSIKKKAISDTQNNIDAYKREIAIYEQRLADADVAMLNHQRELKELLNRIKDINLEEA
jgi:hypothetical protein